MKNLQKTDTEIFNIINKEKERQENNIELIASENIVSPSVMEAVGSILTNKYAEGYPNKRYYGGCKYIDEIEELAQQRLIKIFNAEGYHANVQPHSGAQANMAVYASVLKPGDKIMGMKLSSGGHLTHGSNVNFSGKLYNFIPYGVDNNGYIDYIEMEKLAKEYKPKMIVCGASAYPRIINFKKIREICDEIGAYMFADISHIAGLIVADLHPSPIPYADFVSTTTHKTLRGPRGGVILCKEEYGKALDKAVFPGIQGGPLMHVIAGKAVAFKEAMSPEFKNYQQQIIDNANELCRELIKRDFKIVSNGTDNHLILIDLTNKKLTGKDAEKRLENIGVIVNKNAIPNDTLSPSLTSGIRIGTPAITTRGFKENDMNTIAEILDRILSYNDKENINIAIKLKEELCKKYPI